MKPREDLAPAGPEELETGQNSLGARAGSSLEEAWGRQDQPGLRPERGARRPAQPVLPPHHPPGSPIWFTWDFGGKLRDCNLRPQDSFLLKPVSLPQVFLPAGSFPKGCWALGGVGVGPQASQGLAWPRSGSPGTPRVRFGRPNQSADSSKDKIVDF